jgi:hypothetical protein
MPGPYTRDQFGKTLIHPAANATRDDVVVVAGVTGAIVAVTISPDTAMAGVDTNSATLSLINKGQTGGDTRVVATRALTNTVNLVAFDEFSLTVSTTPATVAVVKGDILALSHIKVGSNVAVTTPESIVKVSIQADP